MTKSGNASQSHCLKVAVEGHVVAFHHDTAQQAAFRIGKIIARMLGAAVVPQQQIAWPPFVGIVKVRPVDVIEQFREQGVACRGGETVNILLMKLSLEASGWSDSLMS